MISVIGLGGAGGNVADEASKMGFTTAAINFSQKDLDSLDHVEFKLRLIGSDGVGHNRDEAINLLSGRPDMAVDFVRENFGHSSIEVIIFVFSTGGGSGAGIAPILIDILTNVMPDKVLVAMPIMPDYTEVAVSQINCSRTFQELSNLNVAVFPVDNHKIKVSNPGIGKNMLYTMTNTTAMSMIQKLYSYTEKYSKNGNFDKKDFKTVLNTRGIAIIAETDINFTEGSINLSPHGIAEMIQKSWERSIFAPIEYNQVIRAGVIFDGQEQLMQFINYEIIFGKFSNGMPLDLFEGNYHESKGKIITVLAGLSWCRSRLDVVDKIVEDSKHRIEAVVANASAQTYESKAPDVLDALRSKPTQKRSMGDILSKYKR